MPTQRRLQRFSEDFDVLLEAPFPIDIYHSLFKVLVPMVP